MKIAEDQPPGLTALDRPNSYIGRSVPRPNLARLTQGRGQYVSDVLLPRMAHVAFVRSPHAHARIKRIDTEAARKASGIVAVVTGPELAKVITPWVGVLTHLKGIKSAPQHAIAVERGFRIGYRGENLVRDLDQRAGVLGLSAALCHHGANRFALPAGALDRDSVLRC